MSPDAWFGWVVAVAMTALAVYSRVELSDERKYAAKLREHAELLRKLLEVREAARRAGKTPPPLPTPFERPFETPRGIIMRRLTGVFSLPRFRLPGDDDNER